MKTLLAGIGLVVGLLGIDQARSADDDGKTPAIEVPAVVAPSNVGAVLVLGPEIAAARDVVSGLGDELSHHATLVRREISAGTTVEGLAGLLNEVKPRVLVLLDNPTVRLYHAYQLAQPPGTPFPPAVILMTVFMEQASAGLRNVTGISYEIPAVTALVNLRSVLGRPITKVGVLLRHGFEAFIARQEQLAAAEGFSIVGRVLDDGNRKDAVKRGLRRLLDYDHVDALWVLNDSDLVNPELVARAWLPVLRHAHVPVVVGVPSLVSARLRFGTFAVVPDHRALGAQAAGLVDDLAQTGWQVNARHSLLPVAVEKILDLGLARALAPISQERLGEVDRVVVDDGGN